LEKERVERDKLEKEGLEKAQLEKEQLEHLETERLLKEILDRETRLRRKMTTDRKNRDKITSPQKINDPKEKDNILFLKKNLRPESPRTKQKESVQPLENLSPRILKEKQQKERQERDTKLSLKKNLHKSDIPCTKQKESVQPLEYLSPKNLIEKQQKYRQHLENSTKFLKEKDSNKRYSIPIDKPKKGSLDITNDSKYQRGPNELTPMLPIRTSSKLKLDSSKK